MLNESLAGQIRTKLERMDRFRTKLEATPDVAGSCWPNWTSRTRPQRPRTTLVRMAPARP